MSLVVGAGVALILILFNVVLLVLCLLRRSRKQLVSGNYRKLSVTYSFLEFFADAPAEALLNNAEFPLLFIFSIAAVAVFLLLVNICILTAFFYRRKKFEGSLRGDDKSLRGRNNHFIYYEIGWRL